MVRVSVLNDALVSASARPYVCENMGSSEGDADVPRTTSSTPSVVESVRCSSGPRPRSLSRCSRSCRSTVSWISPGTGNTAEEAWSGRRRGTESLSKGSPMKFGSTTKQVVSHLSHSHSSYPTRSITAPHLHFLQTRGFKSSGRSGNIRYSLDRRQDIQNLWLAPGPWMLRLVGRGHPFTMPILRLSHIHWASAKYTRLHRRVRDH
jgi:hypothetical protein